MKARQPPVLRRVESGRRGTAWQYGLFAQDEFQIEQQADGELWAALAGVAGLSMRMEETWRTSTRETTRSWCRTNYRPIWRKRICKARILRFSSRSTPAISETLAALHQLRHGESGSSAAGAAKTYKGTSSRECRLAYRPFNDTKTVIRAGFGVFTMTNLGPLSFNNSGNPTSNLHTYTNTTTAGGLSADSVSEYGAATVGVQYGGGGLDQGVIQTIAIRSRTSGILRWSGN